MQEIPTTSRMQSSCWVRNKLLQAACRACVRVHLFYISIYIPFRRCSEGGACAALTTCHARSKKWMLCAAAFACLLGFIVCICL